MIQPKGVDMNTHDSKQKFAKIAMGVVMVILAFAVFSVIDMPVAENIVSAGLARSLSEGAYKVSLEEASQLTQMRILTPDSLPQSTTLKDVYVDRGETGVIILYSSPDLKPISKIGATDIDSAEIAVTMTKKQNNPIPGVKNMEGHTMEAIVTYANGTQVTKNIEQSLPIEYVDVTINGVEGIGFETRSDYSGQIYPASVSWWDNNVLYRVHSHLPMDELVKIAESMK